MISLDTDNLHFQMIKKLHSKVISTDQWNPLIYAIFYGRMEIVKYIIQTGQNQDDPDN